MVFFTCNNCGESVKKPAVEKHYTRCRAGRDKFLSCMDCLKDFRGEEYAAHTKCITEVQKYSGKDYVHKDAKNSNAKKQEGWTDIVHSILENSEYSLSAGARSAFQKLQSYENVPRKKAKFQNFVGNCMRIPRAQAEEVWNVLEKELEKMKESRQQEVAAAKLAQEAAKKESEEQPQAPKKRPKSVSNADEDNEPEKKKSKNVKAPENGDEAENLNEPKKKKSKKTENVDATVHVGESEKKKSKKVKPAENEVATDTPVAPKKKKFKEATEEKGEVITENGHAVAKKSKKVSPAENEVAADTPVAPKKKKSKTTTEENGELSTENGLDVAKKSKNSKPVENGDEAAQVDEPKKKKSKKTKSVLNGNAAEHVDESEKNCGVLNEKGQVPAKESKIVKSAEDGAAAENVDTAATLAPDFQWSTVLTEVAAKHVDGISVERFKKKVFKKYTASVCEEPTSAQLLKKFEKKFKRYLKRSPGLKVEGDEVKPC